MSPRFSVSPGSPSFAVVSLCCLLGWAGNVLGQRSHSPIEFSDPKAGQGLTNLNQLQEKKEGFRPPEEERVFRGFNQGSSLEGVQAPVYRLPANPVILNPRVRELLDKRKNWIFTSPEDLTRGATAESIFNLKEYGPDGKEKTKLSVLELYMERQQPSGGKNGSRDFDSSSSSSRRDSGNDLPPLADDARLPSSLRQAQHDLQKQLTESERTHRIFGDGSAPSSFSDMFGLGSQETLHDPRDPSKDLNPSYHPILGGPNAPGINSLSPFNPFASATDPRAASTRVGTLDSLVPAAAAKPATVVESVSPISSTMVGPDFNTKALSQWNPITPPFPQMQAPRIVTPISMPDFPRRKGI
jgi:hypothetical protein